MSSHEVFGSASFDAIGTSCRILVTDNRTLETASWYAVKRVAQADRAASIFRPDSELCSWPGDGQPHQSSELLGELISAALLAARLTDQLVEPTLGRRADLRYDEDARMLTLRDGLVPDLGATGKARMADLIADELFDMVGCGVLVDLGGDIATAGPVPAGGWQIGVESAGGTVHQVVRGTGQAFATSSTQLRTWMVGQERWHHIIDPRTGRPADAHWQLVTVSAANAVEANAASTAAIILGAQATAWLEQNRLPARLMRQDGVVEYTSGWHQVESAA